MKKPSVHFISLGCSKNLVDSEKLMKQFSALGFKVYHDTDAQVAPIVVINTCGFIGDAKQESIDMILSYCDLKEQGEIQEVYVMGCLSERYRKELAEEIPEVDGYFGKFDHGKLLEALNKKYNASLCNERVLTTPNHYAYLKIAEGCNRACSYCAIPIITGPYKSRTIEDIEEEVKYLVSNGVKEFQVIAQDLSFYGLDNYKRLALPELIKRLSDIKGVEWLRLHYAYPTQFPYEILDVINERENVCKYLDLALQHSSDNMLKYMRRGITYNQTVELLSEIRTRVPDICLRTTLMVGHPNETEEDFQHLLNFVREQKFERMGAFMYSNEEGTYADKHYEDNVPEEVKRSRLDALMLLQQGISWDANQKLVGKQEKIIIDRVEGDYYIGRTQYDSPDVDTECLIKKNEVNLEIGNFYKAEIVKAEEFDLYAKVIS
jgi:ribosomal protein S12 methylthiotransferase